MVYLGMKDIMSDRDVNHGLVRIWEIGIGDEGGKGSGNMSISIIVDKTHWRQP